MVANESNWTVAAGAEGVETAALGTVKVVEDHRRRVLRPPKGVELVVSELHTFLPTQEKARILCEDSGAIVKAKSF